MDVNRRTILAGLGTAGLANLAGCATKVFGDVRPDDAPDSVPEGLVCDDKDFERYNQPYSEDHLYWGDSEDFSLRVNDLSFGYGDTANVSLTNTSWSSTNTGNQHLYNLEIYTEDGWQDVRGEDGPFVHRDEAINHTPLGGFGWEIELTENGIADATRHQLMVCPETKSGRYRFVYWGLIGDAAVAVAFDLHRDL